ncbi:hypothetical protein BJ912DRAFT_857340, partial [Pholiota molesta]
MVAPFPRVFDGIEQAAHLDLYIEPLHWSVIKYHALYDPNSDVDPLHKFGAVDGYLPGRTPEECMELRDVVFRWTLPHNQFIWEDLPSAVETFAEYEFSVRDLIPTDLDDTTCYSVLPARLLAFGHTIIALSQVIQGLSEFLREDSKAVFSIDPGFVMLRLLAWHDNPTEMVLTVPILQERSIIAIRHCKKLFNRIRRSFLTFDEAESVTSYNSTNAEERENY